MYSDVKTAAAMMLSPAQLVRENFSAIFAAGMASINNVARKYLGIGTAGNRITQQVRPTNAVMSRAVALSGSESLVFGRSNAKGRRVINRTEIFPSCPQYRPNVRTKG